MDEERPPMPDDLDAPPPPPEEDYRPAPSQAPMGFWSDLCGAIRQELKPPVTGFFVATPNAPIQGAVVGNTLELRCNNAFAAKMVDKPELLEVVSRKASTLLERPVRAVVLDMNVVPEGNPRLDQLMDFGRQHSDIVKIKE